MEAALTPRVVHCKKSPYDVYVGRPSRGLPSTGWGNPFVIGKDGDRATVIEKYKIWLYSKPDLIAKAKRELRGKVLACWCKGTDGDNDVACHGDVLLEVANS